ncbi:MAG TPA: alpha/beta fold hydrolase [Candidatus Hydrogenedentes bacterium]|nr:alpha/beta fold hydrolase [Candidatus Hydrogenedentota bacterium]HIJ72791.1 alpha/beta fold hydrolase [Candidatus Hydrogenedentota bacterium]
MISLGLAAAFLFEIGLCVAVCVWAWDASVGTLPIGLIVVLAFCTVLAFRILVFLLEFAFSLLSRTPRSPEDRIGFLGAVRMIVGEILAFLFMYCLLLPFSRRLVALRRGNVTRAAQPPVLLIHGYGCNAGIWVPMISYLWRRGLTNVFTMNLHPKHGNIDDYAQQLAARVVRICETTRAPKVILVGHNMGGLVARAYVERCGGAGRVAKIISVGTPHHGTRTAWFPRGVNTNQMRVNSEWLQDLNRDENRRSNIEHVSIYSIHDNVIMPQSSSELGMAKNIPLAGKGHYTLVLSRRVGRLICREVKAA